MPKKLEDVEVTFIHQTDGAWLLKTEIGKGKEIWIPKSLCEVHPSNPDKYDTVTLTASQSILEEKGFV